MPVDIEKACSAGNVKEKGGFWRPSSKFGKKIGQSGLDKIEIWVFWYHAAYFTHRYFPGSLFISWCAHFCGLRQMTHKPHIPNAADLASDDVPKCKQVCETQWSKYFYICFISLHCRLRCSIFAYSIIYSRLKVQEDGRGHDHIIYVLWDQEIINLGIGLLGVADESSVVDCFKEGLNK